MIFIIHYFKDIVYIIFRNQDFGDQKKMNFNPYEINK